MSKNKRQLKKKKEFSKAENEFVTLSEIKQQVYPELARFWQYDGPCHSAICLNRFMLLNLFYRSFFRLSIAHTFYFLLSETRQPLSGRQSILGYYIWKSCLRTTKPTAVTCRIAFFESVVERICKKL